MSTTPEQITNLTKAHIDAHQDLLDFSDSLETRVKSAEQNFESLKNTLRIHQVTNDHSFTKTIPAGTALEGNTIYNPSDPDSEKSSFIILYDGASVSSLKYFDGEVAPGVYIGMISVETAGKGGNMYSSVIGFNYVCAGPTNYDLTEELPISRASHHFGGASIKVFSRHLGTGNAYRQRVQILLQIIEPGRVLTGDVHVTLTLKRII